jgi:hypothetical protein
VNEEKVGVGILMYAEGKFRDSVREELRGRFEAYVQNQIDQFEANDARTCALVRKRRKSRTIITEYGVITLRLRKGRQPESTKWVIPALRFLGLARKQAFSQSLEFKLCVTASQTGSYEKAAELAQTWGCTVSPTAIRHTVGTIGGSPQPLPATAVCANAATKDDTLIVMMDAWKARHRGENWGADRRRELPERVHWYDCKSAVIFKLSALVQTSANRNAILAKHVVAKPPDTDPVAFGSAVQHEAFRMGMATAKKTYVIMDGAVFLWNIFEDRFRLYAIGALDFYHAAEHLTSLAAALFPDNPLEAKQWVSGICHSLKRTSTRKLFDSLAEALQSLDSRDATCREVIERETAYFEAHRNHMAYPANAKQGVPIGSGSMESQCSQCQNRFKRTGQFWVKDGFPALLEIFVRHQNRKLITLWAA